MISVVWTIPGRGCAGYPLRHGERGGGFAAGDAVSGPATVVQAVAHYLTTGELGGAYYHPIRHDVPQLDNVEDYAHARRPVPHVLSLQERFR